MPTGPDISSRPTCPETSITSPDQTARAKYQQVFQLCFIRPGKVTSSTSK